MSKKTSTTKLNRAKPLATKSAASILEIRQMVVPDVVLHESSATLISIPKRCSALLARVVVALVLGNVGGAGIYFIATNPNNLLANSIASGLLIFIVFIGLGGSTFALAHKIRSAPPLVYVTPISVCVKDPTLIKDRVAISWCNVIQNVEALYDVSLELTRARNGLWMEWQFYEQDNEQIVERRVAKLLGIDQLRSFGFKNSWEIEVQQNRTYFFFF